VWWEVEWLEFVSRTETNAVCSCHLGHNLTAGALWRKYSLLGGGCYSPVWPLMDRDGQ